uniref:Uncharacterized protein n=1 Tax=Physcomitrium patens TaxID=3218 RepID=A0A2K1L1E1_PHYPA|nr:hypothetical protein PHYPA_002640 [Physcomitrium patens]
MFYKSIFSFKATAEYDKFRSFSEGCVQVGVVRALGSSLSVVCLHSEHVYECHDIQFDIQSSFPLLSTTLRYSFLVISVFTRSEVLTPVQCAEWRVDCALNAANTPEQFLKLTKECRDRAQKMTTPKAFSSPPKVNSELCKHLADKLKSVVERAQSFLHRRFLSPKDTAK